MHNKGFSRNVDSNGNANEEDSTTVDLRRGPWTLEEDNLLIQYISCHGEGRWNKLAKCAGNFTLDDPILHHSLEY